MSARTRTDWILWAQLGCALVATAHAEYTLVTALGQQMVVAGAVTGALDLYVVRALQKHKDVLPAVLVMVAANVVSILISNHVLPVHWAVLACVGALAPALVWRGHVLRVHARKEAGAVSAPAPEPEYTAPDVPGADAEWLPEFLAEQVHPSVCRLSEPLLRSPDTKCGECGGRWGDHPEVQRKLALRNASAPVPAVPELPSTYLSADDAVHLPAAQAYLAECAVSERVPSVRGLKDYANVGQKRAQTLLAYLGVKK